jgi:glutamyl-tRNA synthetase
MEAARKLLTPEGKAILKELGRRISEIPGLDEAAFDALLGELAAAHNLKKGAVAQPLRLALTGGTASPGLNDIIGILGPERVRKRIEAALAFGE